MTPGIHKTPLEDAVIKEMASKMSEMREESSQSLITSSSEQKWEYVGQGIWENGKTHDNSFNGKRSMTDDDSLNLATSYHQSSRNKASSATQELDNLMQSLDMFKLGKSEEPVSTNLDVEFEDLQPAGKFFRPPPRPVHIDEVWMEEVKLRNNSTIYFDFTLLGN